MAFKLMNKLFKFQCYLPLSKTEGYKFGVRPPVRHRIELDIKRTISVCSSETSCGNIL
jgi:hypothetical protein